MASVIQNAAKGQRAAMQTLYEANKRKVFHIARCVLLSEKQAVSVTVGVFRDLWRDMKGEAIDSEAKFTAFAVSKTLEYCKASIGKKDSRALRMPLNKNFALPGNLMVRDCYEEEWEYCLANLPTLQRLIFVMHAVGGMDHTRIARSLKFDSEAVRAAVDAEAGNFLQLQKYSSRDFTGSAEQIMDACLKKEGDVTVPVKVDEQMAAIIDTIASPVEKRAKKQKMIAAVLAVVCVAVLVITVVGISPWQYTATSDSDGNSSGSNAIGETTNISLLEEELVYYADIVIENYGTITVQLDQEAAPLTCANFVSLAQSGFYDGLTFHRIKEGFMMQGGDPEGNGTGSSDQKIYGEFSENGYDNPLSHTAGAISMARSEAYNSASCQFFIVHEDSSKSLDGKYAVFGYVIEGMEIVNTICESAEPINSNYLIAADKQPVITTITIRTEKAE